MTVKEMRENPELKKYFFIMFYDAMHLSEWPHFDERTYLIFLKMNNEEQLLDAFELKGYIDFIKFRHFWDAARNCFYIAEIRKP